MYALRHCLVLLATANMLAWATPVLAVDEVSAQMLARQSGCFKCHAVEKKKSGPAYTEVANKYRGDSAAAAKLYEHVTSGKNVKFPDGHEEEHRIVQTTDVLAIENLIAWILAL